MVKFVQHELCPAGSAPPSLRPHKPFSSWGLDWGGGYSKGLAPNALPRGSEPLDWGREGVVGQPWLTVGPEHSRWEAADQRAGPVAAAAPGAAEPCVPSNSVGGGLLGCSRRGAGRLGGQVEGKRGPRLSTNLLCGLGEVPFSSS